MSWSVNDVMPGSDGLKIWRFWKTRQLGFYWGVVQLVVEWWSVELEVDLGDVESWS